MFIVWVFIVAIVAILVVYLLANKPCSACGGGESKPEAEAAPAPPAKEEPPAAGNQPSVQ